MTNAELPAPVRMDGMSLPVADVQASVAFYTRLGFTTELTDPSGKGFALMRIGGGTVGLARRKGGEEAPIVRDGIHVERVARELEQNFPLRRAMASLDLAGTFNN